MDITKKQNLGIVLFVGKIWVKIIRDSIAENGIVINYKTPVFISEVQLFKVEYINLAA